jgi:hypothetical protein
MFRSVRQIGWAAALILSLAATPVLAQEAPAEGGEESSGDPLYGYVATAFLAAGAIFAICKSARR